MKHASTGKTTQTEPNNHIDWPRVRAMQDADIRHDADSPRTTIADWNSATMKQAGKTVGTVRRRGPQKALTKVSTTLRLPRETLARWKASGRGWQTRMAEVISQHAP